MLRSPTRRALAVLLVLGALLRAQAPGPESDPFPGSLLGRLPDAALLVVEVGDAGALLCAAEGAVGRWPDGLPPTLQAQLALGLATVRGFLRAAPTEALHALAGGGAAFGICADREPVEALLVLRPGEPAAASELLGRLPPRVHWQRSEDLVLVASSATGLERLRGATTTSRWANWPDAARPEPGELRAYVDLAGLRRRAPRFGQLAVDRLDGGGRFLLAPAVAALAAAQRASASLCCRDRGIELRIQVDSTPLGTPWAGLFAAPGPRLVPTLPPGTLAMLALDRSLLTLLAEPERFLAPPGVRAVQSFLSIADQVDGATTAFTADIVGSVQQPITAWLLPTDAVQVDDVPPVLLPGLAFAAALRRSAAAADLQRTASTFLVIANTERARQRQSLFVARAVRDGAIHGLTTAPQPWRGPGRPPTDQALSPTLLFGHGHVVLATTLAAARAVLDQIAGGGGMQVQGDVLLADGRALAAALLHNRAPIELVRQLDEGETAPRAAQFVSTLAALLRWLPQLRLSVEPAAAATTLHLSLERP